jgi:transposase
MKATQADRLMHAGIAALLESLASIDAQVAKLDDGLKELARRSNEVAWRLMSVPGVGPVTALAFIAAIQNVEMGISKQGDAMARHYLYEAANVLLTTVKKRFALRGWGLRLMRKLGPNRARVAVARKLAVLLGRVWKDGAHFDAVVVA